MAKNVTMEDIASELNISKSLVSRALSERYGVSDETRNKIKLTALKMGYKFKSKTKDMFAKAESITLVVERHDLLDSGFWVKIINGIEKELNKRHISVFLSAIENDEEDMPLSIKQFKTNGVLILGRVPLKHIASVAATGLPVVLLDSIYSGLKFDHVMANNYYGAYEATEFICKSGHRKIGFVGSPSYSFSFSERLRGFTDCVNNRNNSDITPFFITDEFVDFDTPFSIIQFKKIMLSSNRPTALVCANDPTALLIYNLIHDMGFKIPDDISIIGFDNIEKSEWVYPSLTTVNIPKTVMGERAVELLLKRMENPDRNTELLLVSTDIIKRNSVRIMV